MKCWHTTLWISPFTFQLYMAETDSIFSTCSTRTLYHRGIVVYRQVVKSEAWLMLGSVIITYVAEEISPIYLFVMKVWIGDLGESYVTCRINLRTKQ